MNDRGFRVLATVEKVAASVNATPAQVSLSWLAHRPGITAPIASATSAVQLKELVGAIELRLDAEATAALDQASAWRVLGRCPGHDLLWLRPGESRRRPVLRRMRCAPGRRCSSQRENHMLIFSLLAVVIVLNLRELWKILREAAEP